MMNMPMQEAGGVVQPFTLPAPVGGVDNSQPLSQMDSMNCQFAFNLFADGNGMRVRDGSIEHANGLTGTDGVRTMIEFSGQAENSTEDKVFAATKDGIFDVSTADDTSPTKVVTWGTTSGGAGLVSHITFETIADSYLLIADAENGLRQYAGSTGTWSTPSLSGGITAADVVFVMEWKNRLWFIEKDSGSAWYLAVGTIAGACTEFAFGNRFAHGGFLKSMYNWTVDGGDGSDDYLAVLSSTGDLIVYRGTDPATIFESQGSWYIGQTPFGRNLAAKYGGDLLVLSRYGILSMAALLRGLDISNEEIYVTYKISDPIRALMDVSYTQEGWGIQVSPREGALIVTTPKLDGYPYLQFIMNLSTGAWTAWRDLAMAATCVGIGGVLYYGTSDNTVYRLGGSVDGELIDGTAGTGIESYMLWAPSSFNSDPSTFKKLEMARPMFKSGTTPSYEIYGLTDFNVDEPANFPLFTADEGGVWGEGLWDAALWGGSTVPIQHPSGVRGLGAYFAMGIKMTTKDTTVLVGMNVFYTGGGIL